MLNFFQRIGNLIHWLGFLAGIILGILTFQGYGIIWGIGYFLFFNSVGFVINYLIAGNKSFFPRKNHINNSNQIKKNNNEQNDNNDDPFDEFDYDMLRPKVFRKNRNPSFTANAALMAGLAIKQLNNDLESQLLVYPVDGITNENSMDIYDDMFNKEKLVNVMNFNDFTQGALASIYKYFYDGNVDDYQQFRHASLTSAFYEVNSIGGAFFNYFNPTKQLVKTFIDNDKKNKNDIFYLKGLIWGNEYIKRKM